VRILHLNKFLYRRGGAEGYMQDVAALQTAAGHDVEFFSMAHPSNAKSTYENWFPSNVELDPPPRGVAAKVRSAGRMVWSTSAAQGIAHVVDDFAPDIVHAHNIYHQLSPSVLRPLAKRGIPVVMTVHDYKLVCPQYKLLAGGKICEACVGGHFQRAVLRRCQNGSAGQSAVLALESGIHALVNAYEPVRRFLCPSDFLGRKLVEGGVYPDRIHVLNNFVDPATTAAKQVPGGPVLYLGRLSDEKGVDVLIEAMALLPDARLDIAGDGPACPALESLSVRVAPGRVRFHGHLGREELQRLTRESSMAVLPARWYENQPLSVLEAFASGVPVVATDLGGLPEIVRPGETGELVAPNDAPALAAAVGALLADPERCFEMGVKARAVVEHRFCPEVHLAALDEHYAAVLA
jgi:glycosyltransferase involved in cell wall biosynthesis